jgi:hypothetical protein
MEPRDVSRGFVLCKPLRATCGNRGRYALPFCLLKIFSRSKKFDTCRD